MLMKSDLRKLQNCNEIDMTAKKYLFFIPLKTIVMTTKSWTIEKKVQFLSFRKSDFMSI